MPGSVGVGLIGCGRAGMVHGVNLANRIEESSLRAISDADEEKRSAAAERLGAPNAYADYRRLLDDREVQAVVVVTPTKLHCEIVVAAAEAGKHVFCEKPMALNADECRRMIRATRENNVKLQIGFMRRFARDFVEGKQRISDGEIGDVVLVKTLTHGPSTPQPWMYDVRASNGPLAEVNSHDIDTLRWLTGDEFATVHATAGNYRCKDVQDQYPEFYDNVIMLSKMSGGTQGLVEGAVSVSYGYDARVEVLGTKGVMFIGELADGRVSVSTAESGVARRATRTWRELFADAYEEEVRDFIRCVLADDTPRATGQDGLAAVQVVEAGNRSIRAEEPVQLETFEAE